MNLISSADDYGTNTGSVLKYWGADDQLQTAAPTINKLSSAVVFGIALSATTMDVPSYIRARAAERSTFILIRDFGLGCSISSDAKVAFSKQLDSPPLPKSVLASLMAAGVDVSRAASIIASAQSTLSAMGYPVLKIEATNLTDPEEELTYVTIGLVVSASFEKTLELDSTLARSIVKNFTDIPPVFSITVMETA